MRLRIFPAVGAALLFAFASALHAATLAGFYGGSGTNAGAFFGQSFTVTGTGLFGSIAFDFLNLNSGTTFANGTAFLLSTAYSGTPSALSASTPGLLGMATADGGAYSFGPDVLLQSGSMYFLYTNKRAPLGSFSGGSIYGGGQDYLAISAGSDFAAGRVSSDFVVTGAAVTPEPTSLALVLTASAGAAAMVFRRKTLGTA